MNFSSLMPSRSEHEGEIDLSGQCLHWAARGKNQFLRPVTPPLSRLAMFAHRLAGADQPVIGRLRTDRMRGQRGGR